MRMRDGLRGRGWSGGGGSGWSRCKPRDCLRQAKGAPGGDGTAGRRVSWKPNANAEGLAGHAEATQVCSGSRGPRPPAPRGPGGAGAAGGIQESGRAAGAKGPLLVGKKPRAPGIPRWSPIQDPNQARPCLASGDQTRSGAFRLIRPETVAVGSGRPKVIENCRMLCQLLILY